MSTQTITTQGLGCELRFTGGTSDKSYRFVLVGTVVIAHWGRHDAIAGTAWGGQTKVHRFASPAEAAAKVQELIAIRERHDYVITYAPSRFEASPAAASVTDNGRAAIAEYLRSR